RPLQPRAVRARDQRARRLVETDVAVHAQSEDLQADAPRPLDRALVAAAFPFDIVGHAVQKLNPAARQVDAIEEMALHERAIAARIARRETEKLVEVERRRAAEVGAACLVQ